MVKKKKKKAGRPKKYPTKIIRIPVALEIEIDGLKSRYELTWKNNQWKSKKIHPIP